uniref:Probable RNA-binding protein EIF1AD n=1 Tax=Setaria digitata TaxID=48799 RepID=A0A915PUQ7_9BILA
MRDFLQQKMELNSTEVKCRDPLGAPRSLSCKQIWEVIITALFALRRPGIQRKVETAGGGRCFAYTILASAVLSNSIYLNCSPSTSIQALIISTAVSTMSLTTKKRFVMKQAESELFVPKKDEIIARVLRSPGRNLHEVDDEKGEKYLVSMPRKFRETIYIKRGSFVFVMSIEEGVKVKGEITQILDNENVLYLREQKMWPESMGFEMLNSFCGLEQCRFEIYAESITREAKRGITASGTRRHDVIDEDMLPSSDDECDEEEEDNEKNNGDRSTDDSFDLAESDELDKKEETDNSGEEGSDSNNVPFKVYNPNRLRRL